jgi:hypothetical protein
MQIPKLIRKEEERPKTAFGASDFGRMAFDIYHTFIGTPKTNPNQWNNYLKMSAGKGVELEMIKVLKDSGIVAQDFDQDKAEVYTMERTGVPIRMRMDAIVTGGEDLLVGAPLEIKSINNKNAFDIKKYAEGFPRENYVGQLAIYQDCLNKDTGYLFVASIDGLNYFMFDSKKTGEGKYQCGMTQVDINKEYERWAKIWACVQSKTEPDPFEFGRYKIPVEEVDWHKVSKTDISKARNGMKVIGDPESWHISYSPFKALILKAQGIEVAGYTEDEISKIVELTKNYTTWK